MKLSLFASCAPGIEPWLEREIRELEMGTATTASSPKNIVQDIGGVRFEGDELTMAHALVGLGLAARLLIRVATFEVSDVAVRSCLRTVGNIQEQRVNELQRFPLTCIETLSQDFQRAEFLCVNARRRGCACR